jgi:hypothetical protein
MTELKRCPFCGGEAEIVPLFIKGVANHKNYFTQCHSCGFRLRNRKLVDGAEQDWNTRPIEDELNARITVLEIQLAESYQNNTQLRMIREKDNARIKELEERLDDISQDAIERGEYQE